MDLASLATVIGPPTPAAFSIDWPGLEQWLGLRLPDDYKEFAERYGPVLVGEWIWVVVPHHSDRGGYFRQLDQRQGLQRSIRAGDPPSHPFAFHPEPGGLLVWGESRGSEYYFWDTSVSADPNDWPTRVFTQSWPDEKWRLVDAPLTEVLAARVSGGLDLGEALPAVSPPYAWNFAPLVLKDVPERASFPGVPLALEVAGQAARVEAATGVPDDYAALVGEYGVGRLAGVLRLLGPGAPEGFDLAAEEAVVSERLRSRRAAGERVVPSPIAPEPGGLRLWGVFDGGETCWWLPVSAESAEWPVVLLDADGLGWQRLPYGATGFLDRWLDGRLDLPVLSLSAVPRARVLFPPVVDPAASTAPAEEAPRDVLAQLASIIGESRTGGHTYDWPGIERSLGLRLPRDYKRLFEVYGSIGINGIMIGHPEELQGRHEEEVEYLGWEEDEAMAVHPASGGLLWCANTEGRDCIWWDTGDPDPDRWTMVWDVEFDRRTFPGTLIELVIADLTSRLASPLTALDPSSDGPMMWF
ncbi:SMI1/KNR4 family protein [Nonomuraea guangzhouensis]|uniref:SMI1/KNR4 family protein n=1 Tax=Nonomuraea guangzhouensis TaxID=1291555 RepID=A0ABW4GXW3_9ACTN|nr:SMI1/KNR4 family protein [Nonomuraea guangzhouensis]